VTMHHTKESSFSGNADDEKLTSVK